MASRSEPSTARAVAVATAEARGVDGREVAGEVDDSDQRAGVGVVDRRGRADPRLHRLVEVLGTEHLDRVVDRDGGPDRVRAGAALAPQRALGEVHRSRPRGGGSPGCPRCTAARRRRRRRRSGSRPPPRWRPGTRGSAARSRPSGCSSEARVRVVLVGDHRREAAAGGVDAGRERAPPRVGDRQCGPAPGPRRRHVRCGQARRHSAPRRSAAPGLAPSGLSRRRWPATRSRSSGSAPALLSRSYQHTSAGGARTQRRPRGPTRSVRAGLKRRGAPPGGGAPRSLQMSLRYWTSRSVPLLPCRRSVPPLP